MERNFRPGSVSRRNPLPPPIQRFDQDEGVKVVLRGTGTVKSFDSHKGFGWLIADTGAPHVFVHHSAIDMPGFRSLSYGQRVEFEICQTPRGPMAQRVRVIGSKGE